MDIFWNCTIQTRASLHSFEFPTVTLKMTSTQDVEMLLTTKSPSQDSFHLDDQFPSRHVTPGFKSFKVKVGNSTSFKL